MTEKQQNYNWIMLIIDSCNNDFQFSCVDKLIELFYQKHNDDELTNCLKLLRRRHWNNIHVILT